MSRIIVKNLPGNVTGDKLKEKFSEKGRVTDIQLKYTREGKFRKFGFIGFQTEEEAAAAIEYFNNTFYNTSRLKVELCAELGNADKPKAWSKYAPDSSAYKKLHEQKKPSVKENTKEKEKKSKPEKSKKKILDTQLTEKLKKHKDDPEFTDFLELYGQDVKSLLEDVEDSGRSESDDEEEKEGEKKDTSLAHAPISDMEYLKLKKKGIGDEKAALEIMSEKKAVEKPLIINELFTIKLKNIPYTTKKANIKAMLQPLVPASIRLVPKVKGIAYVGFKTEKEVRQALVKNKSFMNGKQILISEYKYKTKQKDEEDRWKTQRDALANEEDIGESGRIFVRNLSYTVTEDELREMFEKHGPVTEVIVPIDRYTRKVKGFGVITYMMPEHAVKAYSALDGTILHGRMLHLLPGKPKESPDESSADSNFKSKRNEKLKASAQSSHTWNTLFLGQDAVAEVIAEKYNATKQEVLTGSDAAVRLALGETQIVAETKQFLEDNGVSLDAFNQQVKIRSKTVILAKNLPANTTSNEIRDLFAKHGELGRVILPPSGVTAIVEFLEPYEARNAFTKLAYTKFKYIPLYLEWAPQDTFSKMKDEKSGENDELNEEISAKKENESSDDDEANNPEEDTTIFVKNLNFQTDDETLKKHFIGCGKLASASVARKKDPSMPGKMLSMGYGFVQFLLKSSANEALKILQGSELEGHRLELKRSNRTLQTSETNLRKQTNMKKQTGTKILVRNIPFQASVQEIQKLFKTFGEIKSIRVPKKLVGTGPHRGFGFIEFVTKHDAKRAMKALGQSTHFFGRRLVLEWAENDDDDVEQLRKRTAKHFSLLQGDSSKKLKKATADILENDREPNVEDDNSEEDAN